MFRFRVEFDVEPGNTQIDPSTVTILIENGDDEEEKWEAFEGVTEVYLEVGNENQFILKKLPESQKEVIKLETKEE